MNDNIFNKNQDKEKPVRITDLSESEALDSLLSNDFYCTTELPEYFDFSGVLKYATDSIGNKSLDECINSDCLPESVQGVNLDVITNKDGRYAVRPLTLANPFLYYMLARDICKESAWTAIKECFKLFSNEHITACAIPMVKVDDKPEPFKGATSILNWWNSMEQRSIELSLKYRYMFMTDITNCFGQINPESIAWALARKDTPYQTDDNYALASSIQRYLRAMQEGKNIGIPQGSSLFSLIAEIILGYTDMLLAQEIANEQENDNLPKELEYEILRYVDDYRIFCNDRDALDKISFMLQHILERFNFRMNSSKTRTSTELITDSIKADKAFYIFNTPIESKQIYKDEDGHKRKERGYDFDGFQKHLLFIYEFSGRFPNSGQLVTQLEALSKRIDEQLSTKTRTYEETTIDLDSGKTTKEKKTKELKGHLWENISAMVAIAVEIAANNLRAANNALKIASQLLSDMRKEDAEKKSEIIDLIYRKLIRIPNSAFLQVWVQNITHPTDEWSAGDIYDMPLCKVVAKQPVMLWNNNWLNADIAAAFPQDSIVDRDVLAKTGQVITFKAKRQYDEMEY
ncbi:MAG: RNA-directed DNA polymerase [Muribaculaceae bacterium]|nr:RNA-directed DNA polymerase [Muribaculaceae bacterium]